MATDIPRVDNPRQWGNALSAAGYTHAALEIWQSLLPTSSSGDVEQSAELWDELGKTYVQLGRPDMAMDCFTHATHLASNGSDGVRYHMHLALLLRRSSEHDKAQRLLAQLIDQSSADAPALTLGMLHGNLALVQAYNGFHREALSNSHLALTYLRAAGDTRYVVDVLTNIGLHYAGLGEYRAAQSHFNAALSEHAGVYMPPLAELCRLHRSLGEYDHSMRYAQQLLRHVWSSFFSFEKEELARLCELLAGLARDIGEPTVAERLLEKAQLFFGQLRLWREWQSTQTIMEDWQAAPALTVNTAIHSHDAWRLRQFVGLLDAMNAQELIHERYSALLDARVLYACALADRLQFDEVAKNQLIYACRFADYGLTALEPEVIANPSRSEHAWQRYVQHPELSIRLLQSIGPLDTAATLIAHHHERYDGHGFPHGLAADAIPQAAQVLAIADAYATGVALSEQPHSEVLAHLRSERGGAFSPECVDHFCALFARDTLA